MIIPRHITAHLQELSLYSPLSLTGPRQAGKSRLGRYGLVKPSII